MQAATSTSRLAKVSLAQLNEFRGQESALSVGVYCLAIELSLNPRKHKAWSVLWRRVQFEQLSENVLVLHR